MSRDIVYCPDCGVQMYYYRDLHKWGYLCQDKKCPNYERSRTDD